MPKINIPKTLNFIDVLNADDLVIQCGSCSAKLKVSRCVNEIVLSCPECDEDDYPLVTCCYVER